jgi:hypothetical protein
MPTMYRSGSVAGSVTADRERRARIICEWLKTEARYLAS